MNLNQSVLVGPTGRALFGVGGENAHRTHSYKGYAVSLEWDEDDGEPMLLMWPEIGGREVGVFGIGLSSAGKYANPDGSPTKECFDEAASALAMLGKPLLKIEANALVDVIIRFIPDLLMMPPAPHWMRKAARGGAVWNIEQRDERGRKLSETEV